MKVGRSVYPQDARWPISVTGRTGLQQIGRNSAGCRGIECIQEDGVAEFDVAGRRRRDRPLATDRSADNILTSRQYDPPVGVNSCTCRGLEADPPGQEHRHGLIFGQCDQIGAIGVSIRRFAGAARFSAVDYAFGIGTADQHRDVEQALIDSNIGLLCCHQGNGTVDGDRSSLDYARRDQGDIGAAGLDLPSIDRCARTDRDRPCPDRRRSATETDFAVGAKQASTGVNVAAGQNQTADVDRRVGTDQYPARRIEPYCATRPFID